MPKTAAFCDLSVRHPRSRPTTASSSSPDLTEKRLVFGAGSFNGADFCRGKEVRAGNTGRIVKHTDAASGVNPPVKTIRGSTLLCYTAALQSARPDACVFGVDISKFALMAAASRDKRLHLAVASSADLPLADGTADVCLAMFSPVIPGEFARVLKNDGTLVLALVGENHLWELKQALYEHPYKNEVIAPELPGFMLVNETQADGSAVLTSPEEIRSLFQMTPYYYKTGREDQAKLETLSSLTVTLSFLIRVYQKA